MKKFRLIQKNSKNSKKFKKLKKIQKQLKHQKFRDRNTKLLKNSKKVNIKIKKNIKKNQ